MTLLSKVVGPWRLIVKELSAFGVVGIANVFVHIGIANFCHFRIGLGPTTSYIIAAVIATTISYFANRHWSFSHRARTGIRREYTLFFLLNFVALGISSIFIVIPYYVLDHRSAFAYNVANIIGIGVGTVFRFWSYKRYVFLSPSHASPASVPKSDSAGVQTRASVEREPALVD